MTETPRPEAPAQESNLAKEGLPSKIVRRFEVDNIQILDAEGNVHDGATPPELKGDVIASAYETMKLLRAFDDKALSLQRQGRMGTYSEFKGQEGVQVGIALALEKRDWFFPTYRDSGAMAALGVPIENLFQYWSGDERGQAFPEGVNVFPVAIPVASQITHAVGGAWSMKYRGEDNVALVTIGDGGTSKADYYEGMNLAGVYNLPLICVIQNNQYAISLPREYQTHTATLAQKGFAFGIDAVQVDGNDLLAVYSVLRKALEKARRGEGPTMVECITYRLGHHTTATGDEPYRLDAEIEGWKHRDPIERLRRYLENRGIWNERFESEVDDRVKRKINDAVKKFESIPPPNPEDMFRYTYSEEPSKLRVQQDILRDSLANSNTAEKET